MSNEVIDIYTDGSCHTQLCVGSWAALLFIGQDKIVLTGRATDTTHNRMELTAVIEALRYIQALGSYDAINIISDSQYVIGLKDRKEKLSNVGFITRKGSDIQNIDLVKQLLALEEQMTVTFTKVKADQQKNGMVNHNIEVDKLSRKIVREAVALIS